MMEGRKGFFSILTGMLFVIVIVMSVLLFFSVYGLVMTYKESTSKIEQRYESTRVFKENLLLCHEHLYLSQKKLESTTECKSPDDPPYQIVQKTSPGCEQKIWSSGNPESYSNKFVYPTAVKNLDGDVCVADMIIYSR